jgi:hypothetical protein
MIRLIALACLLAAPALAETVVAARTIPAHTLIGPDDLLLRDVVMPGGIDDPALIVGMGRAWHYTRAARSARRMSDFRRWSSATSWCR